VNLVADSGALYALYDADDAHHAAVAAVLGRHKGLVVVSAAILAEVDYLLREFLGVDAELDFLKGIADGAFRLEPFTPQDLGRCRELIEAHRDTGIGLADAAVAALAERLGIDTVLTVDGRDFRVIKPKTGFFTLLPADAG
jgi:predicted nucleic acid-binding protein